MPAWRFQRVQDCPRGTRNDDFSPWSGADPGRRSAIQHDCDAAVLEQCPLSEMFNQAPRTNRQHRRVIAECGWPSSAPTPMADDTTRQPIRFGTVFSCVAVGEQEQTDDRRQSPTGVEDNN